MSLSATSIAVRGISRGALAWSLRGWAPTSDSITPPVQPPLPPEPTRSVRTRRIRSRGRGGGGGGGTSRERIEYWKEQLKPYAYFLDPEKEPIAQDADYALMTITDGATVRALADGLVTHFNDARGRSALKLEADDGTNYYYADLSGYVGITDRRVKAGDAVAKSAREATPEITRTKALPSGGESAEPQLRVIAPVFVETPLPPPLLPAPPPTRLVMLVPISPPPTNEWAVNTPTAAPTHPIVKVALFAGALAALILALSVLKPTSPLPGKRRRKRRPGR